MNYHLIAILGLAALMAGCASTPNPLYHYEAAANIFIKAPAVEKTGTFGSISTAVHVYYVDAECRFLSYQGMQNVEDGELALSLPVNRVSYLNVALVKSGLFGGSDTREKTLIIPRAGYQYRIIVRRAGDGIRLSLQERKLTGEDYAEVGLTPWTRKDCQRLGGDKA